MPRRAPGVTPPLGTKHCVYCHDPIDDTEDTCPYCLAIQPEVRRARARMRKEVGTEVPIHEKIRRVALLTLLAVALVVVALLLFAR